MKRFVSILILAVSLGTAQTNAEDAAFTAQVQTVIRSIEALNRFSEVYSARATVTSVSPETAEPVKTEYILFVKGLQSSLMICTAPKKDEGKRILMRGTTFWMYFPKAKKAIIMHPTNSLTGSLSIGDMVSPPLLEIYELEKAEKADDGALAVTFRAKDTRAPYGKVAYRYKDGVVVSQECSTRSGIVLKRISYTEFVETDGGSSYASKVRVVNAVYPGYASTIEIKNLKRVPAFPDSFFTPEGMENAHE